MKFSRFMHNSVALLACAAVMAPTFSWAAQPTVIRDVALQDGGKLVGQVVDTQGKAQAGAAVVVGKADKPVAAAKTNNEGYFAIDGLSGGTYKVATEKGVNVYRLWAPKTAPPSAQASAMIVEGNVVRGDLDDVIGFVTNPIVIGLGVGAAIAIPLALDDDDAPASP